MSRGKFSYRRRTFLAPTSTGFTSYVQAEVESSEGGEYRCGHYMLTLADCRRRIDLEFVLGTAPKRRQSLTKIDLLLEVLTEFRAALAAEAQLIAEREHEKKNQAARKGRAKKG